MAHDTARVSPRLHQTHENWEASHDFPRFSDGRACAGTTVLIGVIIEHNIWVASLGDSEGCESNSPSMQ